MRNPATPGTAVAPDLWLGLTCAILLALAGCATAPSLPVEALQERILIPEDIAPPPPPDAPGVAKEPAPAPAEAEACFTLPAAITFGFQNNPRLRVARAAIDEARGNEQVAFAPFLPQVTSKNRLVGGASQLQDIKISTEPVTGFGDSHQEFSQEEINIEMLVCDFGRRLGRHAQANLRIDITQLQSSRADQTVAFDIATAYYRLLFTQATRVVATQAVRRAESVQQLTENLFKSGVVTRDSVLRADVQLAEVKQQFVSAESAVRIAGASLNFAMGRNASLPIAVAAPDDEPPFALTLAEALQSAAQNRRELSVAGKAIAVADEGMRVARAEFLPRVYAHGQYDEVNGGGIQTGHTEFAGFHLDWTLYDGGRRQGEKRTASAAVLSAVAQAQQVGDTIAYEVNQAFWSVDDARQRIVLARAAILEVRENYRLVLNKYKAGDATPTDLVDAETTLTHAEQSLNTAMSDYRTALARLDYAMGTTPDGCTLSGGGH